MALITDLETLNYEAAGLPFTAFRSVLLSDPITLDYEEDGLPFYAQQTAALVHTVLTPTTNIILISAPVTGIRTIERRFPNKREEMIAETQIKHVEPIFAVQDPIYIP